MWYIIILVIIVALVAGYFYITKKLEAQKAEAVDAVKSRFSGKNLSEKEKRGLAYSAILALSNFEDPISLLPDSGLKSHINGLSGQWGIDSSASAKETIENLLALNRTREFDKEIANHSNQAALTEIYMTLSEELKVSIEELKKVKSTYAWDIGRASALAKWCFWVDYITEEEMFSYLDPCVEIATSKGNSWADFTYSFLIGRCIHGFELKDLIEDAQLLLNIISSEGSIKENIKIYQVLAFK